MQEKIAADRGFFGKRLFIFAELYYNRNINMV
jgi:hypothetical protein